MIRCRSVSIHRPRDGATMVLMVVLLPVMIALAALAINVAQMESVNTDLQVATDAAVRAAGREYLLTADKNKALLAAQELADRNRVGSFVLPIESGDLEYGVGDRANVNSPYTFTHTGAGNAVRLTTNSLASGTSGVDLLFPFFGSNVKIRPQISAVCTQGVIDIALVIDRSGSMAYSSSETAVYPPGPAAAPAGWDFGDPVPPQARWLDLIASAKVFVDELDASPTEELVALTIYDENSTTLLNLSNNYDQIINELEFISGSFDKGGTNIGGGMLGGQSALTNATYGRQEASKVIVLMTDGVHNIGTSPNSAANTIANSGIALFTITFSDEANQAEMQSVANKCGGQHFHAANASQLKDAFQQIARSLPTLLTE
ncbi:VWA domain-containing protein [Mariniblastus fucicola]|uniref:von Willebrand factor type A domain protein n=1 Tax=Mariniblastus fucicola TaxID=980251 RepID=A0A5B9PE01_9BACT|nr:VWA domain-containing protein [Mariniblastus fucicola]QEG24514.1 von Willebrand factor type A domain protein [Mariniblastus fucicola]